MQQKNRKTRKIRGGIHITRNYNPQTAIQYFIKHASFSLFTQFRIYDAQSATPSSLITAHKVGVMNEKTCTNLGSTSIIVKGTLHQNVKSPYHIIRTHHFHSHVQHILFKFFVVGAKPGIRCEQKITTPESIRRETALQQFIYRETFYDPKTLLESLCPAIVYSHPNALNEQTKQSFLSLLSTDNDYTHLSISNVQRCKIVESMFSHDIGFIAMECMDDYKTLTSLVNSPKYEWYKSIAMYELSKLHKLGYMHNDFHYDNVLIHETYNYFDMENSGRAILIDFGDCSETYNMLEVELIPSYYKKLFAVLDIRRQHTQYICINEIEIKIKHNIHEYIKQIVLYKGGVIQSNMSSEPNILPEKTSPKKHKWTFASEAEIDKIMSDLFRSNFKNNPKAYEEFNSGIESFLQEEKKDPLYFEHLMKAQTANLIVKRA